MFKVDEQKCIGCGMCFKDCLFRAIEMVEGKAQIKNLACVKCGHCIAVCPVAAVSTDEDNMADVIEYNKESFDIDPDNLLNFIKFRRSIRHYLERDVEEEKLLKIIEAGRFTPTGTNSQDVAFTVVKESLGKLKEITMESLNKMGEHLVANSEDKKLKMYGKMWINMYKKFKVDPVAGDGLFYNAPSVIVVTAKNPINADIATSNMELMTNALGLGAVYCGFFTYAAEQAPIIREFLQIPEDRKIVTCLVVGYPAIKYKRTVPRKPADITWR